LPVACCLLPVACCLLPVACCLLPVACCLLPVKNKIRMNIEIKTLSGKEIEPWLPAIARLRIEVFREYPYLYDGSMEYEQEYLQTYTQSPDSVAVLAFDGRHIVGASTALPLNDETEEFKRPFTEHGFNTAKIFYCGESVLKSEYRGQGIYSTFFSERERHARRFHQCNMICFCAVERPENHPLKPDAFRPLDHVWEKFGYRKYPELTTTYSWKDIDKNHETDKKMVFWMKEL
jgi:GNAT superfamily N-acetyltransferase